MPKYVRQVDPDAYRRLGAYAYQFLYVGETCRVIAASVPAGAAAPGQHTHEVDQLYYVYDGEIHVVLGSEEFVAGPDTLVFIPAGTPHHNWNEGETDEFHFEVLAPAPFADAPAWAETDSTDAGGRPYFVKSFAEDGSQPEGMSFAREMLLERTDGSANMTLYRADVEPGGQGPGTHIHREHDQFYYVLRGELSVEVALDRFVAGPHSLVVLPAGVPHRLWNEGAEPERHLVLITPAPVPGESGDIPVEFAAAATAG